MQLLSLFSDDKTKNVLVFKNHTQGKGYSYYLTLLCFHPSYNMYFVNEAYKQDREFISLQQAKDEAIKLLSKIN